MMNGKSPHSGAPTARRWRGCRFEDEVEQDQQRRGNDQQQRDRARVVAELPEHPQRRRERAARSRSRLTRLRPRAARSGPGRPVEVAARRCCSRSSSGVLWREQRALAHQQQPVAVARPRPSRGWRRAAWCRRPRGGGRSPRDRAAGPGRGRRSGSSRTSSSGSASSAVASETRARSPPESGSTTSRSAR